MNAKEKVIENWRAGRSVVECAKAAECSKTHASQVIIRWGMDNPEEHAGLLAASRSRLAAARNATVASERRERNERLRTRSALRPGAVRVSGMTVQQIEGRNLLDPVRADRVLRRFSWEGSDTVRGSSSFAMAAQ